MSMTIPLITVYKFDETILDGLTLPTADELPDDLSFIDPIPELSEATLHMQLLFELGELSPVHSDPEILKKMIEIWAAVNHNTWLQLWQTTLYKYNPIWNKDGSYRETRSFSLSGTTDFDETKRSTESANGSSTSNVTHSVTGYDTNSLSTASGDNGTGTTTDSSSGTLTTGADTATSRTESETFEHIEQGNIGVTTTQQMIKEQREIVTFNLYKFIIDSFKKQFMITVWDI